jgi:hypothetical protein
VHIIFQLVSLWNLPRRKASRDGGEALLSEGLRSRSSDHTLRTREYSKCITFINDLTQWLNAMLNGAE